MALVVKNLPAKAGDPGETDLIPGWGRSPGGGHGNPLQDSCWRIPWTEEPGGLQSMGSQSQTRLKRLSTHTHKAPHSKFSSVLRGWGFSLQVWGATLQLMYLGTYSAFNLLIWGIPLGSHALCEHAQLLVCWPPPAPPGAISHSSLPMPMLYSSIRSHF